MEVEGKDHLPRPVASGQDHPGYLRKVVLYVETPEGVLVGFLADGGCQLRCLQLARGLQGKDQMADGFERRGAVDGAKGAGDMLSVLVL